MKEIIQLMSLVLICILQGCSGLEPSYRDITGVWVSKGGAELRLAEDGTFVGSKFPLHLLWLPEYKGQLLQGKGRWYIQKDQGTWSVLRILQDQY